MLQTILCKYCQGSIKDSDRFCYYCGKSVFDGTQTLDAPQTQTAMPAADMDRLSPLAEATPPLAATAGQPETVPDSNAMSIAAGITAYLQPMTSSENTVSTSAQPDQPVFDSFQLQVAISPEQALPAEPTGSSMAASEVAIADKPPEQLLQAISVPPDNSLEATTPEPQSHASEANLAVKPEASVLSKGTNLSQSQNDTFYPQTKLRTENSSSSVLPVNAKQKAESKAVKPIKTVTQLKVDPLAKTRMQIKAKTKTKAPKPRAEKIRPPFYFLLPHMCTLFSILMLLLTVVCFYGFSSTMGVFFLFPCWPLGLLLFALLMFFTPLRDPQAPRGVNFFIKLNLAYNIIMLTLSSAITMTGDQHITMWLFVWFAGGFILPLSIIFLNRRFMHYIH